MTDPRDIHDLADHAPSEARAALAKLVRRRAVVSWWLGLVIAAGFAAVVAPVVTAEHWLGLDAAVTAGAEAPFTVRAPVLAGPDALRGDGGIVVAQGDLVTARDAARAAAIAGATPHGPLAPLVGFGLVFMLAAITSHQLRRSTHGRRVRVQLASFSVIVAAAVIAKVVLLSTAVFALAMPVAALAIVPALALDRTVGLATGGLAALIAGLVAPFDVGLAILLVVQAVAAGLLMPPGPARWRAALVAGAAAAACTTATYGLLVWLACDDPWTGDVPLHAAWLAAPLGPAIAALLAVPTVRLYQRLVGEITPGQLDAVTAFDHPLLRQLADRAPGTWRHALAVGSLAATAAEAIGCDARLVRIGAHFHGLGRALQPADSVEDLGPGATSRHERLPPEAACDATFAHVAAGIAAARAAGLPDRIVEFIHEPHGGELLDTLWAECNDLGNPRGFAIDRFRFPGPTPQRRETALVAICDAVAAASRAPNLASSAELDAVIWRVIHGQLQRGQLDASGLTVPDVRRIADSLHRALRDGDAAAGFDSVERPPARATPIPPADSAEAFAATEQTTERAAQRVLVEARRTTDPSALRRGPNGHPRVPADPAQLAAELVRAGTSPFGLPGDDARTLAARASRAGDVIASSPPPPRATPTSHDAAIAHGSRPLPIDASRGTGQPPWSRGLADRVEASMAADDWGVETPVVAPSEGELRLLFGEPDPTRQLPADALEQLQRRAVELGAREPPRRALHPTAEIDPEDIEAALELAPPARQPLHAPPLRARAKPPKKVE